MTVKPNVSITTLIAFANQKDVCACAMCMIYKKTKNFTGEQKVSDGFKSRRRLYDDRLYTSKRLWIGPSDSPAVASRGKRIKMDQ